jgi:acetyl esterase/lipase
MTANVLDRAAPAGQRLYLDEDRSRFIDWFSAVDSHLLVVAIHGGYWRNRHDLTHLGHLCAALAARGIAVASLEYRRLGAPGGGWPGTFEDIRRDIDAVPAMARRLGRVPRRTVLLGHSAGGQLALWAASSAPEGGLRRPTSVRFDGVVALAPLSDLSEAARRNLSDGATRELLGGGPEDVPERYRDASPIERVPLGVPTVVVHGTADTDVPYDLSSAFVTRARAAGDNVRLVTLEGADHLDLIDPESPFWPRVVEAIESI